MGHQLRDGILASQLAHALKLPWQGTDVMISHVSTLNDANTGSLCFSKNAALLERPIEAAVIAPAGTMVAHGALIASENPRLSFAHALSVLSQTPGFEASCEAPTVAADAVVSASAVIGRGVKIGARTVIGHHVVIADGVSIGADCIIKSNTVIGEAGFGFERDAEGVPHRILHLGSVKIGDRVELGSLNTVCRATLGCTVIEDDVKTDDHVHIAHNCIVRRGALLTACVELSGGVEVGEFSWIGPNSSVIQKATLGRNSFVGIGANVTKSVQEGVTVAGNPARVLSAKSN